MTKSLAARVVALLALIAASPIFAAGFERPIDTNVSPISAESLSVPAVDASQLTSGIGALSAQNIGVIPDSALDIKQGIPTTLNAPSELTQLPKLPSAANQAASRGSRDEGAQVVINDEGIQLHGKAAADYKEVKAIEAAYKGKIDFSESLGVMDDAYSDAYAKISILQAMARFNKTRENSTRLAETLQRIDGIIDAGGRSTAVATQQVYFHHAKNRQSEISEGIRRVNEHLASAAHYFAPGGRADRQFGPLDEVVLGFDTRGYSEIKAHLQEKAKKLANVSGRPIRFVYLDDVAPIPQGKQQMRDALNVLIERHRGNPGLSELIGGVIHSRYTGLLLELRTLAYYYNAGYKILQSGREFFDAEGNYVTELDAVVMRSPDGKIILVEAKSSRDSLPSHVVLRDKVEYKLRTYQSRRAELEAWIGHHIDEVVFSFDVGKNTNLKPDLEAQRQMLSRKYGFPVGFLFINK